MLLFSPNCALDAMTVLTPIELNQADEAYQALYPLLMKALKNRGRVAQALRPEIDSAVMCLNLALDIDLEGLWQHDDSGWTTISALPILARPDLEARLHDPNHVPACSVTSLIAGKLAHNNFFWGYCAPDRAAVWISQYESLAIWQKFQAVKESCRVEENLALLLEGSPRDVSWQKIRVSYQAEVTQLTLRNWQQAKSTLPLRVGRSTFVAELGQARRAKWDQVETCGPRETSGIALRFAMTCEDCACRVNTNSLEKMEVNTRPIAQALTSQCQHWSMIARHANELAAKL